jgi:hypothetical protein
MKQRRYLFLIHAGRGRAMPNRKVAFAKIGPMEKQQFTVWPFSDGGAERLS